LSRIVFFDPSCPQPYDTRSLRAGAMGGSEATLVRIAESLDAIVVQHNRTETCGRYRAPATLPVIEQVVINRDSRALPTVRKLYPQARVFLWLHDRVGPGSRRARWLASTVDLLRETATHIVCVSDYQRRDVEATLKSIGAGDRVSISTIYNPIDDSLAPDGSIVDPDTLVFFSSPNKGLKFALDAFRAMRARMPELRLLVANPGYRAQGSIDIDGVLDLGPLPQNRLHAHVRTALATFAPNWLIPETFGLVLAESLALGTPVLTHDSGAALEVVRDPRQVLPVPRAARLYEAMFSGLSPRWRRVPAYAAARLGLFDTYIERIRTWRSGDRPRVGPDSRFRLSRITAQWRSLLG
jgi:glycosyltransferase involved in cell wall biosynthesis